MTNIMGPSESESWFMGFADMRHMLRQGTFMLGPLSMVKAKLTIMPWTVESSILAMFVLHEPFSNSSQFYIL